MTIKLTHGQRSNWNYVFSYMEKSGFMYNQALFTSDPTDPELNTRGACILSFIYLSGMYELSTIPKYFTELNKAQLAILERDFGVNGIILFNGKSDFCSWLLNKYNINAKLTNKADHVIPFLKEFLGMSVSDETKETHQKKFTGYYKEENPLLSGPTGTTEDRQFKRIQVSYQNGSTQYFPSKEYANEFFDMNPDWRNAIEKVYDITLVTTIKTAEIYTQTTL